MPSSVVPGFVMRSRVLASPLSYAALAALLALSACADDAAEPAPVDTGADVGGSDSGADTDQDAAVDTTPDEPAAPTPELAAYTGGACPTLGSGSNAITSSEKERAVELYLPAESEGAPLVFFWYGAGGSGQTYEWMQPFASAYGVVVAVPRASGADTFEWPILSGTPPAKELVFFDDIVACAVDELGVDPRRIYTSGFSAGALWSSTLVMQRSHVLAAAVIYSGGTDGGRGLVHDYQTPEFKVPVLGLHGGERDVFGNGLLNFEETMESFMDQLEADGHFLIGCDHGLGHSIPRGAFDWGIGFLLSHRFGMEESPLESAFPADFPDYCNYWPLD